MTSKCSAPETATRFLSKRMAHPCGATSCRCPQRAPKSYPSKRRCAKPVQDRSATAELQAECTSGQEIVGFAHSPSPAIPGHPVSACIRLRQTLCFLANLSSRSITSKQVRLLSGKDYFLKASQKSWEFIEKCIVDHEHGEWYGKVSRDGTPSNDKYKVDSWKCPYHNSRTCFEVMERLDKLAKKHRV